MHSVRYIAIPVLLACGGCASSPEADTGYRIANPASQHCVKTGGRVEIRTEAAGQVGYCHLPDGRVVEEWQWFRSAQEQAPDPSRI